MKKAYIAVDMSNDFVASDGSLTAGAPAQAIEGNILARIEEFYENGDIVVFAMDAHEENDPHFELWPRHNVKGTKGALLYGKLNEWYVSHKESERVYFVEKSEYDAFYKTDLEKLLRANGVTETVVGGVCTDICVYLTVYGAYKAGFKTVVYNSECATFTQNQQVFLEQMKAVFKTEIR